MKIGEILDKTMTFICDNSSVILGSILAGGLIATLNSIKRDTEQIKKNTGY